MAKITFSDLTSLANDTSAVDTINANFALIEAALENEVLYRDNPSGSNTLVNDLDFDGTYDILNAASISATDITVNGTSLAAQLAIAAASAAAASTSETNAATSETNAATSETNAAASAAAAAQSASVDPDSQVLWTAAQVAATQTTTTSGSVTLDFSEYNNFVITLNGNITLSNPTTETVGQSGFICFKQDGTGSRTLTLGSQYLTAGGASLALSTGANDIDIIPYVVTGTDEVCLGAVQAAFS